MFFSPWRNAGAWRRRRTQLAISHPVVSRSISELEHTLGVRLLERSPQGVELTEFGRAMLSRSHAAFDELRQGVKDIEFLADPRGRSAHRNTAPLAASFVSAVIDRLYRRYPRMVFRVVTEGGEAQRRNLRERKIDLLIFRKGPLSRRIHEFRVSFRKPVCCRGGCQQSLG